LRKIVLKVEDWVYKKLKETAKEEGKTVEQVAVECIEGSL
jgi:hypothetical protein